MKVLVVGSGGREHALCWAIAASPLCEQALLRAGQRRHRRGGRVRADQGRRIRRAGAICGRQAIDFVVVGPEAPLVLGLVDPLEAAGIKAFGPTAAAAALEGSKAFMKDLCAQVRHPDRRLWPLQRRRAARAFVARNGRADRGQGRRPCRRQGGHRRRTSMRRLPRSTRPWSRRGSARPAPKWSSRNSWTGEEASFFALVRRHDRAAARLRPGPQGRLRRRHRPQHRRHGRLFAGARDDPALSARVMGEIIVPTVRGHGGGRQALQGRALSPA